MLRLAQIDVQRPAELVTGSRRMRAPAGLARELGESIGRPGRSEAEHLTGSAYHRYRRQMRIVVAVTDRPGRLAAAGGLAARRVRLRAAMPGRQTGPETEVQE